MIRLALSLFTLACSLVTVSAAAEPPAAKDDVAAKERVVFREDFESGIDRWQVLDPATWRIQDHGGNRTFEITERSSAYKPPVRSPGHVALVKDLQVASFEITFRVRSTKDTGNHRDCCVFFGYQDDQHFYYVHLGARPDPHSGQVMIVKEAPRKAITENEKPTPWDDQWHTVRVIRDVDSGKIQVFFDDLIHPHMEVVDHTFGKGKIGIGSFDDLNEFDDIVIVSRSFD